MWVWAVSKRLRPRHIYVERLIRLIWEVIMRVYTYTVRLMNVEQRQAAADRPLDQAKFTNFIAAKCQSLQCSVFTYTLPSSDASIWLFRFRYDIDTTIFEFAVIRSRKKSNVLRDYIRRRWSAYSWVQGYWTKWRVVCLLTPQLLLIGTHCTYPEKDIQAEIIWAAGHIPR